MKNLCLVFSLCPIFLWGQVKIDFESELSDRWEQAPSGRWGVTTTGALNSSYSLGHIFDNSESCRDVISYYFGEIDPEKPIEWSFILHHDYNPSGSNNWAIHLLSDNGANSINAENLLNSLILGVNQTSTDDSLRLYFQNENSLTNLLNIGINWEKDVDKSAYSFKIEKDSLNSFTFYGGKIDEEIKLICQTNENIPLPENSEFFALAYEYTSSKDRLFYFDDFEFNAVAVCDSLAPELLGHRFLSNQCIEWTFSENVFSSDSFQLIIDSETMPDSTIFSCNTILSYFKESFQNDTEYHFEIMGYSDKKQNPGTVLGTFEFYYPEYKDLIFTEIMADPSPVVYLPDYEYLEIYNRSYHSINLNGFVLKIGDKDYILNETFLEPSSYLAFVNVNQGSYSDNASFYPLFSGSYVLPNSEQEISLWAPDGTLIEALHYSENWCDDELKSEGGWSLERIDLTNLCGSDEIWTASSDSRGGTPGEKNSWEIPIPDNENPYISNVEFKDSLSYLMHFNETVFCDFSDLVNIVGLNRPSLLYDNLELCFKEDSERMFSIEFGVFAKDCEGNQNQAVTIQFGVPEKVEPLDILITEVMFSPLIGCPEFIEIYNKSEKILNLSELTIDIYNPLEGPDYGSFISEKNILFHPHNYLIITKDKKSMLNCYNAIPHGIFELKDLKTLPDKGGRVAIRNRAFDLIDEMEYSDELHYAMLSNQSGVSLERLDLEKKFGLIANWHSASQNCDFSTPGYQNSQYSEKSLLENRFIITSKTFTPNNDGTDDLAHFEYNLEREGYFGSLMIFDASGRIIRRLEINSLLGISGSFHWDGEDDAGRLCSTGIYLVYFSCIHLSGRKESFKKSVTLIRNF
ncbi:MAG: lamin tail domain-containing protein [Bacteroidales bacterium]|nr:lamin tail domain-containing protein [Bacteroidales bacterium]